MRERLGEKTLSQMSARDSDLIRDE